MLFNCAYESCKVKHKCLYTKQSVKDHAPIAFKCKNGNWPVLKKKNVSTRNLHSSIFIFVSPSLQTLTGGIYTSQKSRETKEMLPIFQLKKGQPGATLYSKVISWVKLSCAS